MKASQSQKQPHPDGGGHWGILGGLFDPVHRGHLVLAEDILAAKDLDGVLFVPAYDPPHKADIQRASFEHRMHMLRLAIGGQPRFRISTIETELTGPGYTLHVVRALKKRFPSTKFCFIIGADNLEDMDNWHRPEQILAEIPVIAGSRPGFTPPLSGLTTGGSVELVTTSKINVASSEIRQRINSGVTEDELSRWVPREVATYILQEGLYR